MMGGIITEAALFAYLLFSYYYFAIQPHAGAWPPEPMEFALSLPNTVILLLSSVAVWWGERGTHEGARWKQLVGLLHRHRARRWSSSPFSCSSGRARSFSLSSHPYGSLYFTDHRLPHGARGASG